MIATVMPDNERDYIFTLVYMNAIRKTTNSLAKMWKKSPQWQALPLQQQKE